MIVSKEREIEKLKLEIQKTRATYENEIKKLKKSKQTTVNSTANNITTGVSAGDCAAHTMNQTFSFDPYGSAKKQLGGNLNQSVVMESGYLNSSRGGGDFVNR